MLLTLMSFKFGVCWMKIGLRTGTNHSVFVVLVNAGANATSKFSFQHSHNTSFGRHSPLLLRATPSLIFAFRAISGDVKDVFVTVSKIYICLTHFWLPLKSRYPGPKQLILSIFLSFDPPVLFWKLSAIFSRKIPVNPWVRCASGVVWDKSLKEKNSSQCQVQYVHTNGCCQEGVWPYPCGASFWPPHQYCAQHIVARLC